MIAKIAGSIGKAVSVVAESLQEGIKMRQQMMEYEGEFVPPEAKTFTEGKFPTSTRYLYLRSKKNQNIVTTIGYYYEDTDVVCYQIARCHNEQHKEKARKEKHVSIYSYDKPKKKIKNDFFINDTFRKEIGRQIVEGRLREHEPLYLNVFDKDDMYNKFIMLYHPDRKERRAAKNKLVVSVFHNYQED